KNELSIISEKPSRHRPVEGSVVRRPRVHKGRSEADGGSNAVLRGLDVLWALTECAEPLSLKEVMDATGMTRATAYRAGNQLTAAGWVPADGWPSRFQVTQRVPQLGMRALHHSRTHEVALSNAIACARATGCPCMVAFYEDGSAVYTEVISVLDD